MSDNNSEKSNDSTKSSSRSTAKVQVQSKHSLDFDPTQTMQTKVQCDASYQPYLENFPGSKLGMAGPFYAVQTALAFMDQKKPTIELHNDLLDGAVLTSLMCGLKKVPTMKDTVTVVNNQNPQAPDVPHYETTVEKIQSGYTILNHLIPTPTDDGYQRFSMIFCKNGAYIVVMGEYDEMEDGPLYYVRNCDSPTQHGFFEKEEIIKHLNDSYSFSQPWMVDGVPLKEYSDISYCFFDRSFSLDPNTLIAQVTAQARQAEMERAAELQRQQMYANNDNGAYFANHNNHIGGATNGVNFGMRNPNPDAMFTADVMGRQRTNTNWANDPRNFERVDQYPQHNQPRAQPAVDLDYDPFYASDDSDGFYDDTFHRRDLNVRQNTGNPGVNVGTHSRFAPERVGDLSHHGVKVHDDDELDADDFDTNYFNR